MDTHKKEKSVDKRKFFTSIETKINVSPRVSISNECVPDGLGNTGRGCATKENDYSEQEKGGGRQSTQSKHYPISYCSDFRYESNGIFVLGVGFFFFRQISTF